MQRNALPVRLSVLCIFVVSSLLAGACCSAEHPQTSTPEPRHEVLTDPHDDVAPAPADTDGPREQSVAPEDAPLPATFDCKAPPPLVPCCRALLPRCTKCADRNRAVGEAYRAQCGQ